MMYPRLMILALTATVAFGGCSSETTHPPTSDSALHDQGADRTRADAAPATDQTLPDSNGTQEMGPDATQPDNQTSKPDFPQTPSGLLAAARTIEGSTTIAVTDLFVTYVRAALGDDGAGFFIQAEKEGPAMFVAIDPASLTPAPQTGDKVELVIKEVTLNQGRREVSAIEGWKVTSNSNELSALAQDLSSAADLVSGLDNYESELTALEGQVSSDFSAAGADFVSASITTAGVTSGNIKLRLPATLQASLALTTGCSFTLKSTPLWRYNGQAQPSAWTAADITVKSCGAPKVVTAIALSTTKLRITFDRPIGPSSINANGDQFTFDNGLSATAASADGLFVEVTTGDQAPGQAYVVTVAASVQDALGVALDTGANTAQFNGFTPKAEVLINEFNVNQASGCDLLELWVVKPGSLEGLKLVYRDRELITLPAIIAAQDDFVIVHLEGFDNKCNGDEPQDSAPADETTSKTEVENAENFPPTAANAQVNAAWDVWCRTTSPNFAGTTGVISLSDPAGTILDAVFYAAAAETTAAATTKAAADLIPESQWSDPDAPSHPITYDDAAFLASAIKDAGVNSTTRGGKSFSRKSSTDTNTRNDWTDQADASWGAKNPGQ